MRGIVSVGPALSNGNKSVLVSSALRNSECDVFLSSLRALFLANVISCNCFNSYKKITC